ncbi:M56 family metallopeptidase [Aetokthonos hydrillicola Thurmond2011]|uniref:M56 family metallopeptidase n=1 Tax=Aetokthonos hydrillicola Thurmond2011 TaxID=2712845 RepID=A0AAP5M8F7_9CYAN|nr:M56 family metallopeptidase [Aetokthonos hydrillicola]MBO3459373.1 M56 family metallopeptidase [Aetokthonos hydrillicola CCALA 1050]MBW4586519.1 M56 family metallopeptidase [Aetokthonos hydrillicola CCALA 1050]MDR9893538.1 M56 family metallopeptidase [Aetokthonos hydrillicola Thurmond2011]
MHLIMILLALAVAYWIRYGPTDFQGNWNVKWRRSLFLFLFPPLLIFTTVISLLCMGPQGKMGGLQTGWFSYVLALSCLAFFTILCIKLAWQGWQSVKSARGCPLVNFGDRQIRLLNTKALFAGQIGFWQPELVLSEGLLQTLSPEQLQTVLAHEQGHYYYRDTFWFFWLGWLRSCTAWLPNTEALWEDLLVLRELRADAHAALQVDPLVLAESLLLVVSTPPLSSEICCAAMGSPSLDRLEQRINALLAQPDPTTQIQSQSWSYFLLALLPLFTIVFHT